MKSPESSFLPAKNVKAAEWLVRELPRSDEARGWALPDGCDFYIEIPSAPQDEDRPSGTVDPDVVLQLVRLLKRFTNRPAECYFVAWEGYAGIPDDLRSAVRSRRTVARISATNLCAPRGDPVDPFRSRAPMIIGARQESRRYR